MKDLVSGQIKFIFQPAEETLAGARAMIGDGVLADPNLDLIVGYHNWPAVAAGKGLQHRASSRRRPMRSTSR